MEEWRVHSKKADFDALGKRFSIDPVVARIIRNRDVCGEAAVNKYLKGSLEDLHSPHLMKDMDCGIQLIKEAIDTGKKIRIIGDYDIDGICSIYILYRGMKHLNAKVDYEVPDRIQDGYGINEKLIDKAYEDGVQVIITCDNGIAAISQIKYAKSLGMTVIVTDQDGKPLEWTNTVENIPLYHLPNTGSIGTSHFTFGGIALIFAAAYMYICIPRRKRQKGGR